jgi:TolB protein
MPGAVDETGLAGDVTSVVTCGSRGRGLDLCRPTPEANVGMTPITYRRRVSSVVVVLAALSTCMAPRAMALGRARILFGGSEAGGGYNVYVARPDGAQLEQLTFFDGKRDYASDPAWSPDGRRIAFSATREWVTPRIYVMDADASNHRLISEGGSDRAPTWSPRGNAVAFWSARWPTTQGIYVADVAGGPDRRLTSLDSYAYYPSWRPVGDAIAYTTSHGADGMNIHIMDAQGRRTAQITARPSSDGWPAWHPREEAIAFAAWDGDNDAPDIHTINADGTDERRVTKHPAWDGEPRWSPDGTQLLFMSTRDGRHALYISDVDGRIVRNVTGPQFLGIHGSSWFDPDVPRSVSPVGLRAATWGWLRSLGRPAP